MCCRVKFTRSRRLRLCGNLALPLEYQLDFVGEAEMHVMLKRIDSGEWLLLQDTFTDHIWQLRSVNGRSVVG